MLEAPSTPLNPSPFLGGTHRPDFLLWRFLSDHFWSPLKLDPNGNSCKASLALLAATSWSENVAWIEDWLVGKLVQTQLVQFANEQWRGLGRQEISL